MGRWFIKSICKLHYYLSYAYLLITDYCRPTAVTVYVNAIYPMNSCQVICQPLLNSITLSSLHVDQWLQRGSTLPSPWDSLLAEAQEGGCHSQSHSVIEDLYKYMETEVHLYTSIAMAMGVIWRDTQRCIPKSGIHELHIHVLYMHTYTQVHLCANELACPCDKSIMH